MSGATVPLILFALSIATTIAAQLLQPDIRREGPRLDDLSASGSQPGAIIPRTKGATVAYGTVIAQTDLREDSETENVGGKGGPSVKSTTYTYEVEALAVAFSSREIGAITRIKANETVIYEVVSPFTQDEIDEQVQQVYDDELAAGLVSFGAATSGNTNTGFDDPNDLANAAATQGSGFKRTELEAEREEVTKFFEDIEIFLGTETQAPSGILEAVEGVGNLPGYRGTAYFVLKSFQLESFGNRMPIFKVEVGEVERDLVVTTGPDEDTDLGSSAPYIIDYDRDKVFAYEGESQPFSSMTEYAVGDLSETQNHDLTTNADGSADLRGIDPDTGYLFGWHPDGGGDMRMYIYDPVTKTWINEVVIDSADFDDQPSDFDPQHFALLKSADGSRKVALSTDFFSGAASRVNAYNYPALTLNAALATPEPLLTPKWTGGRFGSARGEDTAWVLWDSEDNLQYYSYTLGNDGVITATPYGLINRTEFHATEIFNGGAILFTPYVDQTDDTVICSMFTEPPGGGGPTVTSYVFKFDPALDAVVWVTEVPVFETETRSQGNTRLEGGFLALSGDTFTGVYLIDTTTGAFSDELETSPGGAEVNLFSTSWDGASNCLFSTTTPTADNVLRTYCWALTITGQTSIGAIIRDAATNWTPDISPLIEGDHFFIDPALDAMVVIGATFTRLASVRQIADMCALWRPIVYFEGGDQIKFLPRDGSVVAALRSQDMRARAPTEKVKANVTTKRLDDVQLPREVRLKYLDFNRLFSINTSYARLVNSRSALVVEHELPFVGVPAEAKRAAYMNLSEAFATRRSRSLQLQLKYFILEPADIVDIPLNDGVVAGSRITKIEDGANWIIKVTAQDHVNSDDNIIFDAETGVVPGLDLIRPLPAITYVLDLPTLTNDPEDTGLNLLVGLGFEGSNGAGSVFVDINSSGAALAFGLDFSDPNDTNFVETAPVSLGVSGGTLSQVPNGSVDEFTVDTTDSMLIHFDTFDPQFTSLTDAQFETTAANTFAVGDNVKGWEIIQAKNALRIDGRTYEFWDLHRGLRGTEWAIGQAAVGDQAVHLSEATLQRTPIVESDLGETITYRGATSGTDVTAAEDVNVAVVGRGLIPWAPTLGQVYRDGAGEITGTLGARPSQANADGQFFVVDPDFEIDIYPSDPSSSPLPSITRTITLTDTDAYTYTVAQQVTDFGSTQPAIFALIYQLDASGGRGYAREVIL